MGILKFIFVIFLGALSLGEIIRFDLGNNIFIKPVDIVITILLLAWIVHNFENLGKIIKTDSLFSPIKCVIIIMCISIMLNFKNFSSNEIIVGLSYIVRWIFYASLYFVVKSFPPKLKGKILYLLLIIGGLFTFFGFIQYFFYSNLRNLYYLGWDEHMHRMFSTFLDPNFAGGFFVLYLLFLLSFLLYLFKNNKIREVWLISLVSVFSLISIFLSHSRSALIMLLTAIVIFSILTKKLYWFFGFALISIIFILISSKNFDVENINLFRIASTEARIDSAKIALKIINDNPFFGVGFNTYRYSQIKYGFRDPANSSVSHADAGTDNSFLFIFATTGIVGLIFYSNLLLKILQKSYLNYRRYNDKNIQKYIGITAIASMGGIIIDSFFINSLFYPGMLIWMWVLLGLMERK